MFYGLAVEEIQAGKVDKGLMAKAIAKSKGDKKGAEVLYLEWRVDLLKEEAVLEFKRREADAKKREADAKRREAEKEEDARWREATKSKETIGAIAMLLFGLGVVTIVILTVIALTPE